ncbi:hypothetical protein HGO34_27910 [Agrobacterium vitis]|uniref:Uncharacterized protein n=1 Tax=Agrobacterium vitis TaxID=373 RepID=A0AAE4WH92_AGRVI|nr:hypothetical protein [Agrobacterium vitis]MCF1502067.1 hypothetical protein [Allorhizobium sp. Av2]MCM2443514.1 hypothetical protein [Agrobacterium vitis]MUZ61106.1 hypothetical protein [Agrobacterium vitis]MVA64334.1 hypothetical protein [Agrobacterium vitis]MVA85306.1 hypothetical protein [Agrobacterium vitis]
MFENANILANAYNALPDLDEADFQLNSRKDGCIDFLLSIIMKHGKHEFVGIRLLHKHNLIENGEIMAEYHQVDKDGFSLITRATKVRDWSSNLRPNSWIFKNGEWTPMEFSNAELLKNPNVNPSSEKELFQELADAINLFEVEDVIGPSLMGSDLIDSYRPDGEYMLVEQTALDDRANILRYAKIKNNMPFKAVETHWCMEKDKEKGTTIKSCKKICPPTDYSPSKHNGTYIHKQD